MTITQEQLKSEIATTKAIYTPRIGTLVVFTPATIVIVALVLTFTVGFLYALLGMFVVAGIGLGALFWQTRNYLRAEDTVILRHYPLLSRQPLEVIARQQHMLTQIQSKLTYIDPTATNPEYNILRTTLEDHKAQLDLGFRLGFPPDTFTRWYNSQQEQLDQRYSEMRETIKKFKRAHDADMARKRAGLDEHLRKDKEEFTEWLNAERKKLENVHTTPQSQAIAFILEQIGRNPSITPRMSGAKVKRAIHAYADEIIAKQHLGITKEKLIDETYEAFQQKHATS